jgi:hypothetical protein
LQALKDLASELWCHHEAARRFRDISAVRFRLNIDFHGYADATPRQVKVFCRLAITGAGYFQFIVAGQNTVEMCSVGIEGGGGEVIAGGHGVEAN